MSAFENELKLRFPVRQIRTWAGRYDYGQDDNAVALIGATVRERGFMQKDELAGLCYWKSPRIRPRCDSNEAELIKEATATSLAARNERLRIGILMELNGVGYPMASVILHFCHRDPYPIIDYRALWSLSTEQPKSYSFDFWWKYVTYCRCLAAKQQIDMRTLDRALWQYSKVNQDKPEPQ